MNIVVKNMMKKATESLSSRLLLVVFRLIGISSHNVTAGR